MGKPRRGSATPHYSAGRVGCAQVWKLDWATLVIGWSSELVSGCELASNTAALGFLSSQRGPVEEHESKGWQEALQLWLVVINHPQC